MILYNITMNIEEPLHVEWLAWMKADYIPSVVNSGLLVDKKIFRLLNEEQYNVGITYSFQFFFKNLSDLETYMIEFEPEITNRLVSRYREKCMQFSTILESLD